MSTTRSNIWGLALVLAGCAAPNPAPAEVSRTPGTAAGQSAAAASAAPEAVCEPSALRLVETQPVESVLADSDLPATHRVWLELIDGAQRSLDIEQFYLSNRAGSRMEAVLAAIERAADRGVRVRVLADAGFAKTYPDSLERLASRAAVRRFDVSQAMGGVQHAKFFVVDGCASYLGSANFDWRSLEHVHELGVALRESALAGELTRVFEMDWRLAAGEGREAAGDASWPFPRSLPDGNSISAVVSPKGWLPPGSHWDLPALLAMIDAAKRSVRVALLSFQPSSRDGSAFTELDEALRRAGARGVDVRLIVSHWDTRADNLPPLLSLQKAPGVTVKIATVEPHPDGFIPYARVVHAKYLTVDGAHSWVGTSNWSGDYFFKSRNVGLLIDGAGTAAELERVHQRVWSSELAQELDPTRSYPSPKVGP